MQCILKLKLLLLYIFISFSAGLIGFILNYHGCVTKPLHIQQADTRELQERRISSEQNFVVPNIVHFIWFADEPKDLNFVNYISMLSAYRTQKPDQLILHCDLLPTGQWWDKAWEVIPFTVVKLKRPETVFGQKILHKYHQSDVARIEILIKYGGIYLDIDVILVNSLDPLRHYDVTLGKEKRNKLNFGIIIAKPGALYLTMLRSSYKGNYRPLDWDYNSARIPFRIYQINPQLVHVEPKKLSTPDWLDRNDLWERTIDWRGLYTIHIMGHLDWREHTPESIKQELCTFGEVMRHFYFGSSDVISA